MNDLDEFLKSSWWVVVVGGWPVLLCVGNVTLNISWFYSKMLVTRKLKQLKAVEGILTNDLQERKVKLD